MGSPPREAKIHRAEKLEVYAFDRAWIGQLVARLERRMQLSVARSEAEIYLGMGGETYQTVLGRPVVHTGPAVKPSASGRILIWRGASLWIGLAGRRIAVSFKPLPQVPRRFDSFNSNLHGESS